VSAQARPGVAVLLGAVGFGVFQGLQALGLSWSRACIGLVVVPTPVVKVGLRAAGQLCGSPGA
jgi:hypothetical protein